MKAFFGFEIVIWDFLGKRFSCKLVLGRTILAGLLLGMLN